METETAENKRSAKTSYHENALYRIIWDITKSGKPCMCPIETPPGSGKSTAVDSVIIDSVQEAIDSDEKCRKFFLISTQHKNLDQSERRIRAFIPGTRVLRLKSIPETAKNFVKYEKELFVPEIVAESREYKDFIKIARDYAQLKTGTMTDAWQTSLGTAYGNLKYAISNAVNRQIFKAFKKNGVKKRKLSGRDREIYIHSNMEWQFLYTLFPAMRIPYSDVIIMTVDKLYYPLTTVTQRYQQHFYDAAEYLEGSIVFFDESDSCVNRLREIIIENTVKNASDIISVFIDIWNGKQRSPEALSAACMTGVDYIQEIWPQADKIYQKYHIQFPFQTEQALRNEENSLFMFKTGTSSYYDKGQSLYVHTDESKHINIIYTPEKGKDAKPVLKDPADTDAASMAWEIYRFIRDQAINWIYPLATKYKDHYSNTHPDDIVDTISYQDSFETVMRYLGFHEQTRDFLVRNFFISTGKNPEKEKPRIDGSFYERGFAIALLDDGRDHNENTQVRFFVCQNTPEKILTHLAESGSVFMVSATARIESVVRNANYKWVGERLGNKFHQLTASENKDLSEWLESQDGLFSTLKAVLSDNVSEDSYNFYSCRYLSFLAAYQFYAAHNKVDSMLVLGNTYLGDKPEFSMDAAATCCSLIDDYYNVPEYRRGIKQLKTKDENGDDIETQKKKLDDNYYSQGCHCFVYSVFKAVSIGQNLQHKYSPGGPPLVRVNKYKEDTGEKDYDAVYIMTPTHIIVSTHDAGTNNVTSFLEILYQVESMHDPVSEELTDAQEKFTDHRASPVDCKPALNRGSACNSAPEATRRQ